VIRKNDKEGKVAAEFDMKKITTPLLLHMLGDELLRSPRQEK
jgi:hypothetical protein